VIGWSGYGMEMAVYAIRHPDRVTRLLQVAPVPPAAGVFRNAGGDRRAERMDTAALAALDRRARAGEYASDGGAYCRARRDLTGPSNFADPNLAARVPDPCRWENEWPVNLGPYFEAFLPTLAIMTGGTSSPASRSRGSSFTAGKTGFRWRARARGWPAIRPRDC
jgi:pimeloyl-ACP methyl ester carboxylesterase